MAENRNTYLHLSPGSYCSDSDTPVRSFSLFQWPFISFISQNEKYFLRAAMESQKWAEKGLPIRLVCIRRTKTRNLRDAM